MSIRESTMSSAADLRARLLELGAERAGASLEGLDHNDLYMSDLEAEVVATRAAFVGAAVTEIAILRAALGRRPEG